MEEYRLMAEKPEMPKVYGTIMGMLKLFTLPLFKGGAFSVYNYLFDLSKPASITFCTLYA